MMDAFQYHAHASQLPAVVALVAAPSIQHSYIVGGPDEPAFNFLYCRTPAYMMMTPYQIKDMRFFFTFLFDMIVFILHIKTRL